MTIEYDLVFSILTKFEFDTAQNVPSKFWQQKYESPGFEIRAVYLVYILILIRGHGNCVSLRNLSVGNRAATSAREENKSREQASHSLIVPPIPLAANILRKGKPM